MRNLFRKFNSWNLPTKLSLIIGVIGLVWAGNHYFRFYFVNNNQIGDKYAPQTMGDSPGGLQVQGNVTFTDDTPKLTYELREGYPKRSGSQFVTQYLVTVAKIPASVEKYGIGTPVPPVAQCKQESWSEVTMYGELSKQLLVTCMSLEPITDDGQLFWYESI